MDSIHSSFCPSDFNQHFLIFKRAEFLHFFPSSTHSWTLENIV